MANYKVEVRLIEMLLFLFEVWKLNSINSLVLAALYILFIFIDTYWSAFLNIKRIKLVQFNLISKKGKYTFMWK